MEKPVLAVMAAGMGSRYGGLKQIDPVGKNGEIIMDFSLYDAWKAGFQKVVFIIKKELEDSFCQVIGDKVSRYMEVEYAFQSLDDLPEGYSVPEGRIKPWGTGHAVLSCRNIIKGPFAVINADDYYGKNAYTLMYDFLANTIDDEKYRYAMVGYTLENTTTEHGHVARGVCEVSDDGYLKDIIERTHIQKRDGKTQYTEDGENWVTLPEGSIVSMNLWGFTPSFLKELEEKFPVFLDRVLKEDPLKAEFFLPSVVDSLLKEGKATVKVLHTPDKWYGVTYREDKPLVAAALTRMQEAGMYPEKIWEE
ncbi:MAG: nucleotidyltransferase family protein [Caldicoprobacterales bacterium]|nr:nucleotidyltransferase [Clostridiales bacterium]